MTESLLHHLPGSELPADLGTKVLASEKFKQHKINMGMILGEEKNEDAKEKKEGKEQSFSSKIETTKQALKAIILFARMAMAKGQEENQVRLWQSSFQVQPFYEPSSGPPFYIIIFLIFLFGLLADWSCFDVAGCLSIFSSSDAGGISDYCGTKAYVSFPFTS